VFNLDEKRMSFTEHLGELRVRLIRIATALVVTSVVGWMISGYLLDGLRWPLNEGMRRATEAVMAAAPKAADGTPILAEGDIPKVDWVTLTPQASFIVQMRLAMYFGLLVSFPVLVYQICAFIFPGLKTTERRIVVGILGGSSCLAVFGTATAYAGVLPFVMPYLLEYTPPDVHIQLELGSTLSFILTLIVGFAVAFQFPMFVLAGVLAGVVDSAMLIRYWRVAVVAIALVSAVLTPPDLISMSAMMAPLLLLYGFSILVAIVAGRRRNKPSDSTEITKV
jgi:sec-independent protein translocase protein TatC